MSSSAAKKLDDEQQGTPGVDMPSEREQRLSKNFEDPVLEELIPGLVQASETPAAPAPVVSGPVLVPPLAPEPAPVEAAAPVTEPVPPITEPVSVVEEAVEAVQDLMWDAAANSNPAILLMVPPEAKIRNEQETIFGMEGHAADGQATACYEMAEKLFQLVVCERAFPALVESALLAIMKALGARAGSILELDVEQQNYFFRASVGEGDTEKLKAFRVPMNKGIAGHVAETRRPLLLRNLDEDKMQMKAISMSVGLDAKTCMAAPIIVGNQLYGVIEVFNRIDGGLYEERDLRVLEEGVRMTAKVLEVRFLMAELMRRMG